MSTVAPLTDEAIPATPSSRGQGWPRVRVACAQIFRAEAESTPRRWFVAVPLVTAAATLLSLLRLGTGARTIWAEDGSIFLQGEHDSGYIHTLLLGYDGYLHLVPRTLAWAAAAAPLNEWALSISVASAVATGLASGFIARALPAYGVPRLGASVLALALPLAPIGLYECLDVAANEQWFLAAACFWALMWAPREARWIAAGSLLVFLTVGSAPLTLTFAPIAIIRLIVAPGRSRVVPIAYVLGAGLQIFTMFHSTREAIIKPTSVSDLLYTTAIRLYAVSWFGRGWTISSLGRSAALTALAAGIIWLVVLAGCWRSWRSVVLLVITFVGAGVLFGAGTYYNYLSVTKSGLNADSSIVTNGRYSNSPSVIIVTGVIAALLLARHRNRLAMPVAVLVSLLALATVVNDFHYFAPRQPGPTWSSALAGARATCIKGGVTIEPLVAAPTPVFQMHLSCKFLLSH